MNYLYSLLFLFIACSAPIQNPQSEASYIIKNVNVIDVRDGSIGQEMDVIIADGKISSIIKSDDFETNAQIIDGTDKYLVPGLTEMHAHIPSPQWGRDNTNETLFLFLSNGVTTIRGMLGHPAHLELREKAANNEILSPRIFTSSPSVNGNTVKSVEEAIEKVTKYKNDGYDFLKIHPGLTREVFDQVEATAKEAGIGFSGHVPVDVGIRHAIKSGYGTIDHVDGFLEGLVPSEFDVNPNENGFFGFNFSHLADTGMIDELVALTKSHEVWVVPTQSLFVRWFSPVPPEKTVELDPDFKYMPKSTVDQWVRSKRSLIQSPDFSIEKYIIFTDIRQQMIKALHENGHGLLLGSDAPQVFNVPGFSIHHELKSVVDAGISPLEAIQTGTINPAKFFGMEGKFGEVIEGASADLILLDQNPLEDLKNLRNPVGVMVRGQWLDKATIDQRLAEIAERAKDI
ncbi:amidohydrolase family protein [Ekhidna sp.]|uniref:amidohydrolase family protein n=1 Tax=Ekhidna sp. TaxID=2608089 RepID=UPI003B511B10